MVLCLCRLQQSSSILGLTVMRKMTFSCTLRKRQNRFVLHYCA
nr:MAG TPA: hypothetical protein [Caudoviricetes sp.]